MVLLISPRMSQAELHTRKCHWSRRRLVFCRVAFFFKYSSQRPRTAPDLSARPSRRVTLAHDETQPLSDHAPQNCVVRLQVVRLRQTSDTVRLLCQMVSSSHSVKSRWAPSGRPTRSLRPTRGATLLESTLHYNDASGVHIICSEHHQRPRPQGTPQ